MRNNNNKGMALIGTMYFAVILYAISGMFALRVINENNLTKIERTTSKSFYAAQGGAEEALRQLDILINTNLSDTIYNASPSGVISYAQSKVNTGDGLGWLVYAVRNNNVAQLAQDGDQAEYTQAGTIDGANYNYTILLTEKDDPADAGPDAWDFSYSYSIESTGTLGDISKTVKITGDFTVQVQRDNFAKYALFTNSQTTTSGTNVWFTDKTNFSGPLHSNGRFNFAFNPSGTFDDLVQQQEQQARVYNNGWTVLIDAESNGTTDVPAFNAGYDRGVSAVTLSSPTLEADMVDQVDGNTNINSDGIYVPNQAGNTSGGIFVEGDCTISMSVDGNDNAVYTIVQGSTTKNITVDRINSQTIVQTVSGSTAVYDGLPDGEDNAGSIIYVNGDITSLGGTVQRNTELTIASNNDIVIQNNVLYSDYDTGSGTPGVSGYVAPSVTEAVGETKNLLGLVSWNGDVMIGPSAPNNVNVHATVLSGSGVFTVDDYDQGSPRGTATILGGVITDNYGAFGLFNGSTGQQISGYGRNFVYDQRMGSGSAPPYFPTLDAFLAFSDNIDDKLVWQEGE